MAGAQMGDLVKSYIMHRRLDFQVGTLRESDKSGSRLACVWRHSVELARGGAGIDGTFQPVYPRRRMPSTIAHQSSINSKTRSSNLLGSSRLLKSSKPSQSSGVKSSSKLLELLKACHQFLHPPMLAILWMVTAQTTLRQKGQ